jgi:hypothetical protein
MKVGEIIQHPAVFALGVGVANGVLAAVRDKPVTPMAAAITAAVITAGEIALIFEEPERPPLLPFAAWTVAGTYAGLYGFVSWKEGEKPIIQRAGESIADWYYERQLEAGTAPVAGDYSRYY